MIEYAAKFTELEKLYPHYDGEGVELSKCIKFESGLKYEVKKVVGYQKIRIFSDIVDDEVSNLKCFIIATRHCA